MRGFKNLKKIKFFKILYAGTPKFKGSIFSQNPRGSVAAATFNTSVAVVCAAGYGNVTVVWEGYLGWARLGLPVVAACMAMGSLLALCALLAAPRHIRDRHIKDRGQD